MTAAHAAPATPGVALVRLAHRVRAEIGQHHRWAHVLRVARLASRLAAAHGADRDAARLAGLLHDVARLYDAGRLLTESRARGLAIDAFAEANPIVLHAPLGAAIARDDYGIGDERVLDAIAKHTVAAAEMSVLDIIVYLADALEPGRAYPERAALEALALADLRAALLAVIDSSIAYLEGRGLAVAPQTLDARRTFADAASVLSREGEPSPALPPLRKDQFCRTS